MCSTPWKWFLENGVKYSCQEKDSESEKGKHFYQTEKLTPQKEEMRK